MGTPKPDVDGAVTHTELPKESDWVLGAPYVDKSLMRNTLAYHLYRQTGRYASRWRHVELFLSDDGGASPATYPRHYRGVYFVAEKIKRDAARVAVRANHFRGEGDGDVTGGYIFKVDHMGQAEDTASFFRTSLTETRMILVYPNEQQILPTQSTYIEGWINSFESVLYGMDWLDAEHGYRRLIDVGSFVDYLLVAVELTNNPDALVASVYLSKEADELGGKMTIGPPWDFNYAFGNCVHKDAHVPRGWRFYYEAVGQGFGSLHWYSRLMQDPEFSGEVKVRWAQLRAGPLGDARLQQYICSEGERLAEPAARNFAAWGTLGRWTWGCEFLKDPPYETYADEVDALLYFVIQRAQWMDAHMSSIEQIRCGDEGCNHNFGARPAIDYTPRESRACLQSCTWRGVRS